MSEHLEETANSFLPGSPTLLSEDFAQGQVVVGKYKIVSLLGRGGIGSVYKVEQVFLSQFFALKTLNSQTASNQMVRRFHNEAKAAAALSHPNLVKVIDFGLVDGQQPYLVMELVDGISLSEYLKDSGVFSLEQAVGCFAQVCLGLSYAHDQGIVHRDIKPGNIMIARNVPFGAEGFVKVVDFGIAKLAFSEDGETQSLTTTGEVFGSPLYMSPEQCAGTAVDHRSDIYSLGCVLFESLTGTSPFVGQNALSTMMLHQSEKPPTLKEASLGKEFPPALEHVVAKLLAKSPVDRYQNLGIVANDLAQIVRGAPVLGVSSQAKKETKADVPLTMTRREFRKWIAATAIGAALASGAIGYSTAQWQSAYKDPKHVAPVGKSTPTAVPVLTQPTAEQRKLQAASEINKELSDWDRHDQQENHKRELVQKYEAARAILDSTPAGNDIASEQALRKFTEILAEMKKHKEYGLDYNTLIEERIGHCNARLKRYAQAEKHLHLALKSVLRAKEIQSIAKTYDFMAEEMQRNGKINKVIEYRIFAADLYKQVYEMKLADPNLKIDARHDAANNMRVCGCMCYEKFGDNHRTTVYTKKAIQIMGDLPDDYLRGMAYMLLSASLTGEHKLEEAKAAGNAAVASLLRVKHSITVDDAPLYTVNTYRQLASIAIMSKDYDTARANFLKAQKVLLRYKPFLPERKKARIEGLAMVENDLKTLAKQ